MDQWAARAGSVPLNEWRGKIELEQFLAGPVGRSPSSGRPSKRDGDSAGEYRDSPEALKGPGGAATATASTPIGASSSSSLDTSPWGLTMRPQVGRGDLVQSTVKTVTSSGVFVGLSKKQDGLIPVSQV